MAIVALLLSGCTGGFTVGSGDGSQNSLQVASFATGAECPALPSPPSGPIDVLPYMMAPGGPNINEFQYSLGPDPEGQATSTFLEYKLSSRESYEVYHYDSQNIYLRFEVYKPGDWIRRFDDVGLKGTGLGAIWSARYAIPGQWGLQTNSAFDQSARQGSQWVNVPAESRATNPNYLTLHWSTLDWGGCNRMNVLRLQQEWEQNGQIYEYFDYAKDKGIVHWEWSERLDFLMSRPGAVAGEYIGYWDQGKNVAIQLDTSTSPPKALQIDRSTGKTRRLSVYYWVSHYTGKPAWYVATREQPYTDEGLSVKPRYPSDPVTDYQVGGGLTIAGLPRLYTLPPTGVAPTAVTTVPTPAPTPAQAPQQTCSAGLCAYIGNLYTSVLGRSADAGGMQYWLSTVASSGISCAGVATAFLISSEFQKRNATLDDAAFTRAVFQGLLGRAPAAADVASAVSYLGNHTWTRTDYASFVLSTAEFNSNCQAHYGFPAGAGAVGPLAIGPGPSTQQPAQPPQSPVSADWLATTSNSQPNGRGVWSSRITGAPPFAAGTMTFAAWTINGIQQANGVGAVNTFTTLADGTYSWGGTVTGCPAGSTCNYYWNIALGGVSKPFNFTLSP